MAIRKIRIIENTDPIGTPQIKDGDEYTTMEPNTPTLVALMKEYPTSVLIDLKGFGAYRVDEVEFEFVD